MKTTFIIAAVLTVGYVADMHYFNGMYSTALSEMLGVILRHFH
jgi:hypothetical protein